MKRIIPATTLVIASGLGFPSLTLAHCPLCTVGAGAAAVIAMKLGLNGITVGLFIGAFATALGFWTRRLLMKKNIRLPQSLVAIAIFLLTVLPILPMFRDYSSIYVSLFGDYGSLLNRTYMYNTFLVGSMLGGILMVITPSLSRLLSRLRSGSTFAYQGMIVTGVILVASAIISELAL